MKKIAKILIIVGVIIVLGVAVTLLALNFSKPKTNLPEIASAEDLTALVDKIYEGLEIEMPSLMSQTIDLSDPDLVKMFTGLDNGDNLEYVVVSEPLMTSQAYSLILAKVKDGVNVNEVAKTMNENIDARKWICVSAEKVYTTSSGNVVCLVMSREELAKPVYEKFKALAGRIGKEFEKTEQEPEMPADMY